MTWNTTWYAFKNNYDTRFWSARPCKCIYLFIYNWVFFPVELPPQQTGQKIDSFTFDTCPKIIKLSVSFNLQFVGFCYHRLYYVDFVYYFALFQSIGQAHIEISTAFSLQPYLKFNRLFVFNDYLRYGSFFFLVKVIYGSSRDGSITIKNYRH